MKKQITHTHPVDEEFVRTIAHDMKSKLTSMQAYTQLLQRRLTKENKDSTRFLSQIETHIKSFTDNTVDVTDFLKYSTAKCKIYKESFSLYQLIDQIYENLKKNINLPEITKKNASDITLFADKIRLEKTLINILLHGIDETEKISIQAKTDAKSCILSIEKVLKDSREEKQQSVFDELKLLTAKAIIALHAGNLEIKKENKKKTYFITLPLEKLLPNT